MLKCAFTCKKSADFKLGAFTPAPSRTLLLTVLLGFLLIIVLSLLALIRKLTAQSPEEDLPHEVVPEEVKKQKQEERRENLVPHPPDEPPSFLGVPLPGVRRDEVELVPHAPERLGAEVYAEVRPDDHERRKANGCRGACVNVVEELASRKERVGDIHRDENCRADHGEVDEVRPSDQPERDEVVRDEFVVVLSWLLELDEHDERLLEPVAELEQVVVLELRSHLPVWVFDPEVLELVPPTVLEFHHVDAQHAECAPVAERVALLHQSHLLRLVCDAIPLGERLEDPQRYRLADEAKDDNVEGDEGEIPDALLVASQASWIGGAVDGIFGS